MHRPLVSVIIPNYCHARYLDQRIQSVLDQTYQNFEIIILDDCSPDDGASRAVIEKYRNNTHVSNIVYNQANCGNTFVQWNRGFELANGELIWIAESDDFCEPVMLELLVSEFERHSDCVIAYSTLVITDSDGNILLKPGMWPTQHYSGRHYLKHYLALANFIRNASCAVFKRSALENIDRSYVDFVGAGDYLFWVEIARRGSVSIVNQPLCYFRRHASVVTAKKDADGTNFLAEKKIYNHLMEITHLGLFRQKLAFAYRAWRIRHTIFENDTVIEGIRNCWKVPSKPSLADRMVLKAFNFFLDRYNYYI